MRVFIRRSPCINGAPPLTMEILSSFYVTLLAHLHTHTAFVFFSFGCLWKKYNVDSTSSEPIPCVINLIDVLEQCEVTRTHEGS